MAKTAKVETENNDVIVSDNKLHWYVVSTRAGQEQKAARQIEIRAKVNMLEDQIKQVIVPTQQKIIAKDGKRKTVEEKIFPGYVLVNMILTDDTWRIVRNAEGVIGFVSGSKKPTPLSEEEVKATLSFSEIQQTTFQTAFRVGQAVKIAAGPFQDLIGNIESIDEDKGQMTVLISMFGREVPKTLSFTEVTNL